MSKLNRQRTVQTQPKEEKKTKFLNRGDQMDHMIFPENAPGRIIIPSNRKGTGFLKTCYDPR